jgi:hypothetical protein
MAGLAAKRIAPKVGLGLYQNPIAAYVFDIGVFLIGCALYVHGLVLAKRKKAG